VSGFEGNESRIGFGCQSVADERMTQRIGWPTFEIRAGDLILFEKFDSLGSKKTEVAMVVSRMDESGLLG